MPSFTTVLRPILTALLFGVGSLSAEALPASFLKTNGYLLCDHGGTGQPLVLRGTNLGGWLMFESWMCPTGSLLKDDAVTCQRQIDALLTTRFGTETKNRLVEAYQANWITDTDLDHIASLGMNLVRVPFSYLMFFDTQPASVPLDKLVWKPDAVAFKHLDWVIEGCRKRGMYVLLDLHEVESPTAQGTPEGPESFWKVPTYQDRMTALWQRIATRYRGNPTVIGYDLLNEPWSTPIDLYDRFYRAIRAIDPDHTIFVESWGYGKMPSPYGPDAWTNVVCSLHFYNKDFEHLAKDLDEFLLPLATNKEMTEGGRNIPIHIGEFHIASDEDHKDEAWQRTVQAFADNDIPWNSWTWKTVNQMSWSFINGVEANPTPRVPDLQNDSAEAIERAWAGWRTTPEQPLYAPTRNRLAGPLVKDDTLTADAKGVVHFDVDSLVDNDRCLSSRAELSILELPPTTAHGTITTKDGSYTYQAAPGFSGTDTFTYTLMDARTHHQATRPGIVTITVPKRSP